MHKIALNNRKMKMCEIADVVKISTDRVHKSLDENLGAKVLFEMSTVFTHS